MQQAFPSRGGSPLPTLPLTRCSDHAAGVIRALNRLTFCRLSGFFVVYSMAGGVFVRFLGALRRAEGR